MLKVLLLSFGTAFIIYAVFGLFIERDNDILKENKIYKLFLLFAIFAALMLRLVASIKYRGNIYDVKCFGDWATKVYENGFSSFYKSGFADYPPGYIYVLYVIGWLKDITGLGNILVKMPPVIFDIVCSMFILMVSSKRFSNTASAALCCLYMFSPAVIFNSAVWGQVDIVHTTLLAFAIYLVCSKKLILSYFVFAVSIMTKPQSLIFTPIFMIAFFEECLVNPDKKKIFKHIGFGALAGIMMILIALPFGLRETASQYISTLKSYPYATVNAYNLYGAFKLNWIELETIPVVAVLGKLFLVLIVLYIFFSYYNGNKNLYFLAGVIMFMTFMLSTKMHERYAYPSMLMFLMGYITEKDKESGNMFALSTFSQLINTLFILTVDKNEVSGTTRDMFMVVFSVVNIIIMIYMFYACHKMSKKQSHTGHEFIR